MKEDFETKQILNEQALLAEITNHQGWSIVRRTLAQKILNLRDAFDIDITTPTTMFRDLQARKKAADILSEFMQELEGAKDMIEPVKPKDSFIIDLK